MFHGPERAAHTRHAKTAGIVERGFEWTKEGFMRLWLVVGIGVIGLAASLQNAGAADSGKQSKGIVNERSTGNEPAMGPGASGGPMNSTPGATERSTQGSSSSGQVNTGADLTGGRDSHLGPQNAQDSQTPKKSTKGSGGSDR
jgi:hypothetical protein